MRDGRWNWECAVLLNTVGLVKISPPSSSMLDLFENEINLTGFC